MPLGAKNRDVPADIAAGDEKWLNNECALIVDCAQSAALAVPILYPPAASAVPSLPNEKYATAYFSVRKRT